MTEESARKVANVMLGAAVVGAAVVVLRNPPVRRMAWRLAVAALTGAAPAWVRNEVQRAWVDSGQRSAGSALT